MSLRKFGSILVVALALGAVMAAGAYGAVETKPTQWYTGATGSTTLSGDGTLTASLVGTKATLETTVGTNNVPLKLTATGLSCVSCKITNMETTTKSGTVIGVGKGQIKFTGVTADEPTPCTARGVNEAGEVEPVETVTTRPLTVHTDFMDTNTANKKDFQQFFPTTGSVFATVKIEGTGCSGIAGKYNVTGTVYAESANNTEVFATSQENLFSPAIQTTAGGELLFGGGTHVAKLTGAAKFELGGTAFGLK